LARLTPRVQVMNDADLGALGEAASGAARGLSDFIYLRVASGVGSGLVFGGQLYRGGGGFAGDIGHLRVREEGEPCACGSRGCLETLISLRGMAAGLQRARPGLRPLELLSFLSSADPEAREMLYGAGWKAGRALFGVVNLLNPEAVLIGGSLAFAGEEMLAGLRDSISTHSQPTATAGLRIERAQHRERAEVLGGLALAFNLTERGSSPQQQAAVI
jgi:predicted NBD/HSP70 family sugar kinase